MIYRALRAFVFLAVLLASGLAEAACTSPTGNEGTINYDTTNHILQYCNGTSWTTAGGGSSQWTTSGSIIYYNTGNVGIGSTSPGQKLSVAGTIESTSGGVKFPDGTTQTTAADITPNVQTFNASGTWTKPTGGTMARLQCWGGGGGGGNWNPCCNGGGGGGGGGGYNELTVTLATLGASQTVTVGAGGAVNSAGGNSSIGTLLTATGGTGGTSGGSTPGIGGGPGSATYAAFMPGVWTGGVGTDNSAGTPAGISMWGAGGGGSNSAGGTSLYGGSGGIGSGAGFANATAGTAPGGGGGGGKGAAGAAGRCIITVW